MVEKLSKKEVKYIMVKKEIDAVLEIEDGKYILYFFLEEIKSIDLYNDNSDQIKTLFVQILREIIKYNISFNFKKGNSISENDNSLPYNVAKEYVNQLNIDLDSLKTNPHLIEIRK